MLLPQVFLVQEPTQPALAEKSLVGKHQKSRSCVPSLRKQPATRCYLGDYEAVQYLEDCGVLDQILLGQVCPHYRIFRGRVCFQFTREPFESASVEVCTQCYIGQKA